MATAHCDLFVLVCSLCALCVPVAGCPVLGHGVCTFGRVTGQTVFVECVAWLLSNVARSHFKESPVLQQ